MTHWFRFHLALYRGLLRLYPADLRRAFGSEMVEMFAYDFAEGTGIKDTLKLWRVTLRETIDIVASEWWDTPEITVPLLSAALAILANSPAMIFATRGQSPTALEALSALAIVGSLTALTSFIAVRRWTHNTLICLRLF